LLYLFRRFSFAVEVGVEEVSEAGSMTVASCWNSFHILVLFVQVEQIYSYYINLSNQLKAL
jgi:hypothetical protein